MFKKMLHPWLPIMVDVPTTGICSVTNGMPFDEATGEGMFWSTTIPNMGNKTSPDICCENGDMLVVENDSPTWVRGRFIDEGELKPGQCAYCGQFSQRDVRGGCMACGAPKAP